MKNRNIMKKLLTFVLVFVISLAVIPAMDTQAKGETWVSMGNGWHYLQGTDVKVHIENGIMKVTGTGAMPDYDYWSLNERPWNKSVIQHLYVEDTITYVGEYEFANMESLKNITISSKTFVADATAFMNVSYKPIFRIVGNEETTEYIGTIPYTSLDSIKTIAQTNYIGASYILDTPSLANTFQNSTNPTIPNVFYAGNKSAPWNEIDDNRNGNVMKPICRLSSENPSLVMTATGQKRYQGRACYEAYAAFIDDYTFAAAYQIDVVKEGKIVTKTDTELKYVLTIPEEYRLAGRSFRLLAIGQGVVNIYDDLDSANDTITFATSTPTTAYALVYK